MGDPGWQVKEIGNFFKKKDNFTGNPRPIRRHYNDIFSRVKE
jgi:hypothetical protein